METALAEAVSYIETGMENKGIVLTTFLDVDDAFDHTTKEAIEEGMTEHKIPETFYISRVGKSTRAVSRERYCPYHCGV